MEWILTYVYDYEYAYNAANQMTAARLYDGKHYKDVEYTYDADGNRIMQEEVKPDGDRKVELTYDYSVENRLKTVSDKNDLLVAMAYDGDGNRIFQLNYNLHTDDDWKGNSGNGNGNNKDNSGSGNSGNGTGSKSLLDSLVGFFTGDDGEPEEETETTATASDDGISLLASNKDKDKGNDGNDKNSGGGNGNGNNKPGKPGNNGNGNGNNGNGNSENNGNTSTGGSNDNNGNANGNTNNTGGSQNQSGILFPIGGEVSELESELIGMIKTTGKEKNYELVEYVNDVNREHTEVLMELNINGIMDTAYSYGNERLTNERFTGWTGYYTYDPRGSVTGVTDDTGMIWQSYRYNVNGDMTFGKPQYNNVYSYNAESYNPNMESQYLRARYYNVPNANFLTADSYLGDITAPLILNRYNYVKSSPLNYIDPSGHDAVAVLEWGTSAGGFIAMLDGPVPGYADIAGAFVVGGSAIVAGGMVLYDGITYIWGRTSQANDKKNTDDCLTENEESAAVKEFKLPSWNKVTIDMDYIISGHTAGGGRGDGNKDKWPDGMTATTIAKAIEEAYKNAEKAGPVQYSWKNGVEHARQFFEGVWNNRTVQFWFDYTTNQIDSAGPH